MFNSSFACVPSKLESEAGVFGSAGVDLWREVVHMSKKVHMSKLYYQTQTLEN